MSRADTPTQAERHQDHSPEDRVRQGSELEMLQEISRTILDSLDLKVMMERILNKAAEIGGFDIGMICFVTTARQTLEPVAHRGFRDHENLSAYREHMREQSTAGIVDRVIATKEIRVVDLQTTAGIRTFKREGVRSLVVVPLRTDRDALGIMYLGSRQTQNFEPSLIRLLEAMGTQAGIGIQKIRLFEAKDELLALMTRQKEELSRLNAGLEREIAERGRARAEIAAKNRDLETLLYVTSHDLREPLRAIENFSRIVNDRYSGRLDDKGRDFLRRIISGAQRLNRLLDDILTLSRSQRIGAPSEKVDGASIVSEALKRLEGKINATSARIQVAKDFSGLRVDRTWATQAVYNLIANALKFTREGAVPDVEVAPYRSQGSDSNVIGIVVRDRGPGIAPEHAERIFQLFQRAVGREVEGTGAGLAIVRQIAERHGGRAWVEPREGGGSEFIITFG